MTTKFQHSWELFKASVSVTFQYPKLLLFPVLTTILTAFIALFFFAAIALPAVLITQDTTSIKRSIGSR